MSRLYLFLMAGAHSASLREDKPDDPQIVLTEPGIGYRVAEG